MFYYIRFSVSIKKNEGLLTGVIGVTRIRQIWKGIY